VKLIIIIIIIIKLSLFYFKGTLFFLHEKLGFGGTPLRNQWIKELQCSNIHNTEIIVPIIS